MAMTTLAEKIAVMQAALEGKQIQTKAIESKEWIDVTYINPTWNWQECDYRVKPESRRVWVNFYPSGTCQAHDSKKRADLFASIGRIGEAVEFVEVMPK